MENLKTPENIEKLKRVIRLHGTIMNDFYKSEIEKAKNGKRLNELQIVIKDFLDRTGLNVLGIRPLLDSYKSQNRLILPIGLILRSIYSDFLSQCYFMTFCKNDMDVTESFSNEVSLFDRDFIKSMIEMMEYEAQLEDFITVVPQHYLGKEGTLEKISRVKANHQHFFGKNGKYKSANELRSTSDPYIFKKYNTPMDQPNTGFVTESYKWKRVKSHEPFRKYILVFFGYKIFSQFQHYSKRSMELLDQKHEAMLFYHLCLSIDAVRIITDMQIQIIDTNQSPYLERLREVGKGIEEIFNNK